MTLTQRNWTPTSQCWQLHIGHGVWSIQRKCRLYASAYLKVTRSFAFSPILQNQLYFIPLFLALEQNVVSKICNFAKNIYMPSTRWAEA